MHGHNHKFNNYKERPQLIPLPPTIAINQLLHNSKKYNNYTKRESHDSDLITPQKSNIDIIKNGHFRRELPFHQTIILVIHVNFRGCIPFWASAVSCHHCPLPNGPRHQKPTASWRWETSQVLVVMRQASNGHGNRYPMLPCLTYRTYRTWRFYLQFMVEC